MVRMDAVFTAAEGLSPDLAVQLSQHASRYKSDVMIECGQKRIRLYSLIGILSLEFHRGIELAVIADGEDESSAVEDIRMVLAGK